MDDTKAVTLIRSSAQGYCNGALTAEQAMEEIIKVLQEITIKSPTDWR